VTLEQIEELRTIEALLPITPDSVVERYRRYAPGVFYTKYSDLIGGATVIIDSLNSPLPVSLQIDTLAIEHTFESIGEAARRGRTLYLSSSYFGLFESLPLLRSIIFREFGHVYYALLGADKKQRVTAIWHEAREMALFYIFRDGEYSENARFGGPPEDSPEEIFASAFNLFSDRSEEVQARAGYVTFRERNLVNIE
jgi:hypothetical protein